MFGPLEDRACNGDRRLFVEGKGVVIGVRLRHRCGPGVDPRPQKTGEHRDRARSRCAAGPHADRQPFHQGDGGAGRPSGPARHAASPGSPRTRSPQHSTGDSSGPDVHALRSLGGEQRCHSPFKPPCRPEDPGGGPLDRDPVRCRARQHQPPSGRVRGGPRLVDRNRCGGRGRGQRPFRGIRDPGSPGRPGANRGGRLRIRRVGPPLRRASGRPDRNPPRSRSVPAGLPRGRSRGAHGEPDLVLAGRLRG